MCSLGPCSVSGLQSGLEGARYDMVPTTEWYWKTLLILAMVICVGWFLFRVNQLAQFTLMGVDSKRFGNWGTRLRMLAVFVFGQFRMYSRRSYTIAGIAHFFTFWGFLVIQV